MSREHYEEYIERLNARARAPEVIHQAMVDLARLQKRLGQAEKRLKALPQELVDEEKRDYSGKTGWALSRCAREAEEIAAILQGALAHMEEKPCAQGRKLDKQKQVIREFAVLLDSIYG